MGAESFTARAKGKSAKDAFEAARDHAFYEYGHRGYTGSIAEKTEFVVIALPPGQKPEDVAMTLINSDKSPVDDKWGPAGCFDLGGGEYYFFGWASS